MKTGDIITDQETGKEEKILEVTSNSYLVSQTKTNDKGINCDQWFDEKSFNKRFK